LIFKQIWSTKFVRHTFTLFAGAALAQAIPVLVSPLLTRLYTPADFGVLAIYMTILSITSVIITGRYELAIVLPKVKQESADVALLTIFIALLATVVLYGLLFLFKGFIFSFVESKVLQKWLYVLPLIVFFQGVSQTFNFWLNKQNLYPKMSVIRVIQAIMTSGSRVGLGFYGLNAPGLLYGTLLGSFIGAIGSVFFSVKTQLAVFKKVTWRQIKNAAIRYQKFPKFSLSSGLLNTLSQNIPVLALTAYFSASVVGLYALAHRILKMSMRLVGRSVSRVFYERASDLVNEPDQLRKVSFKIYNRLLLIGMLSLGIIMFFGDHLFAFVFGEKWFDAGKYARVLSFWILFNFVASPLSFILTVLEKQEKTLIWEIILFVVRLIPFVIGIILGFDAFRLLAAFSIASGLYYFSFCIYSLKQVYVPYGRIVINTLLILIGIGIPFALLRMLVF